MGRPEKSNADYFSHDNDMRNDEKIKAVRSKFRHEGYSAWCMLLEKLCKSDMFKLEYNELNIELWGGDFDLSPEKTKEIVDYFLKIKLIFQEGNYIFSTKLIQRLEPLTEKRKRDKERLSLAKNKKVGVIASENEVIAGDNTQSKVKKSKVKKSKVKKSKVKKSKVKVTKVTSSNISAKGFAEDSFQYKAAKYFLENKITNPQVHYQVNKQGKEELLQRWSEEVDKMNRIDGYTEEQIDYILKYTLQNEFWNNQILSMKKFRDKNPNGVPYFVVMVGEVKKQKEATPKKSKKKVWE